MIAAKLFDLYKPNIGSISKNIEYLVVSILLNNNDRK